MRSMLDEAAILRVLRSLLPNGLPPGKRGRAACAASVRTFFEWQGGGTKDPLLTGPDLDAWAAAIHAALGAGTTGITVHTSGSTGAPCARPQPWDRLEREVAHWALTASDRRRIVQHVPSHHVYGCIFTVLLPARLGIPVLDASALPPDQLAALLRETDLLVAAPPLLAALVPLLPRTPDGLVIVSAGAPLPWEIADALYEAGAVVHDIYGSAETGGVAVRTHPATWHRLLPFWRGGQGGFAASVVGLDGVAVPLPDRVVWKGPDTLRLDGRKDVTVQVGGADVYPARVAAFIAGHPMVAECAVRLDTTLPQPRLKAAVVPRAEAPRDASRLVATLEAFCRAQLTGAERPARIDIMPALPRSIFGKAKDWDQAA